MTTTMTLPAAMRVYRLGVEATRALYSKLGFVPENWKHSKPRISGGPEEWTDGVVVWPVRTQIAESGCYNFEVRDGGKIIDGVQDWSHERPGYLNEETVKYLHYVDVYYPNDGHRVIRFAAKDLFEKCKEIHQFFPRIRKETPAPDSNITVMHSIPLSELFASGIIKFDGALDKNTIFDLES